MPNSGAPKKGVPPDTCSIKCKGKTNPADDPNGKPWSKCDYEQFCAKMRAVARQARQKGKLKRFRSRRKYKKARDAGDDYAALFRKEWPQRRQRAKSPEKYFYAKCAYKESQNGQNVDDFQADHVHEVQLGGPPCSPRNIKWC